MTALRVAWFFVVLAAVIIVGAPLQWLLRRAGFNTGAGRLQVFTARRLCGALRLQVHVTGALLLDRPALVVANHVSWTDVLAFASVTPLCFLAKADVAGWPLLGPAVRAYGTLFVSRRRTKAFGAVNAEIAAALARGEAVVLFAEGTTGNGTRLKAFRSGHLAAADVLFAQQPALAAMHLAPAAVAYTGRGGLPLGIADRSAIAWFGDMPLLPHLPALLRHGPIRCDIVWSEALVLRRGDDRKAAAATLRARVRQDFLQLVRGETAALPAGTPVQPAASAVWSGPSMPAAPRQISSPGPVS